MPFTFKQEKPTIKNRKPLSSSTNTKDSISRKQKSYTKKEHPKQPHEKLINRSTINTKNNNFQGQEKHNKKIHINYQDQKSQTKKYYQQHQHSPKPNQQHFKANQTSIKLKQSWGKLKQSGKQVYFYDKYSKKDIVNISIIEEKSLLSNNQQNSLDSLNNFIIEGNNEDKSLLQKSHESSSFDDEEEDWTLMQNEFKQIIQQDEETLRENQYLKIMRLFSQEQFKNQQISEQGLSPQRSVNEQIKRLKQKIRILKQLKNSEENIIQESSAVINEIIAQNQLNQKRSQLEGGGNSGFSGNVIKSHRSNNQNSGGLQKQVGSIQFQNEKLLGLEIQGSSGQIKNSLQNVKGEIQQKSLKGIKTLSLDKEKEGHLLQDSIQLQKNDNQVVQQTINDEVIQQQKSLVIEQQEQFQNQSILQDQKSQQQFIRYMDKEYLQKKQSQDNQPNLSLNNISNIMRIKPLQLHNKSIENQHQIKQKQDDQVVAMLENQLRDKKSKLKTKNHTYSLNPQTNNLFLKQENLLQLKQEEQQSILKQDNQIILKDDNEIILMKQSRDNICLNQSDYQTNLQTEQSNDQNNNFFFALNARQKWIQSLDKDTQWKQNQLALIAKMKKILHNPYIQFQDY